MKYPFGDEQREVVISEEQADRDLWVAVGPSLEAARAVLLVTDRENMVITADSAVSIAVALLAAAGCSMETMGDTLWTRVSNCGFQHCADPEGAPEAPQEETTDLDAEAHLRLCQRRRRAKAKVQTAIVAAAG